VIYESVSMKQEPQTIINQYLHITIYINVYINKYIYKNIDLYVYIYFEALLLKCALKINSAAQSGRHGEDHQTLQEQPAR